MEKAGIRVHKNPLDSKRRTMSPKTAKRLRSTGKCVKCGRGGNLEIGHIRPKALGFTLRKENRQVLCRKCNLEQGMHSICWATKTYIAEPYLFALDHQDLKKFMHNNTHVLRKYGII